MTTTVNLSTVTEAVTLELNPTIEVTSLDLSATTQTVTLTVAQNNPSSVGSVNGQTGDVVLDADDIDDTGTVNKFTTQTEKDKLAGIEAGAKVNVNADWNASSGDAQILNKPTLATVATSGAYSDLTGVPSLGTAAATNATDYATAAQGLLADTAVQPADIANFETTTQLNARDTANRSRANHTGTQAISTIDGLQSALDGKEPADPTILKSAAIGVTVQPYNANTVVDANYVAYSIAEKNKLAGIQAGAEVNVNADWNAVSGDAQILNKPTLGTAAAANVGDFATAVQGAKADSSVQLTGNQSISGVKTFASPIILPNNSRINGVEHFYQTTKPTVRGDSSALAIGDRWWKTDDGTEWFWNGTYWLGERKLSTLGINNTSTNRFLSKENSHISGLIDNSISTTRLFIEKINYSLRFEASTGNINNHWVFELHRITFTGSFQFVTGTPPLFAQSSFTDVGGGIDLNLAIFPSGYTVGVRDLGFVIRAVGSPPSVSGPTMTIYTRDIYAQ